MRHADAKVVKNTKSEVHRRLFRLPSKQEREATERAMKWGRMASGQEMAGQKHD